MNTERFDINAVDPAAYQPLYALNNQVKNSSLTMTEFYLIEIRASQINGCAYCIQMHTREAIENGEKQYRIHALPYWRESPFYTEEEKIIIEMTEEITNISQNGLTDELYDKAIARFDKKKIADIIMAVCNINTWNRIGRSTLLEPQPAQA